MEYSKDWEETGTNPDKVKDKYQKNKDILRADIEKLAEDIYEEGASKNLGQICLDWGNRLSDEYNITHYDLKWEVRGVSVVIRIYTAPALGAVLDRNMVLLDTLIVKFN
jgi:hypothetical protein